MMPSKVIDEMIQVRRDRQNSYGNPEDCFSAIAHMWTTYINADLAANEMPRYVFTANEVATMMALLKIVRMKGGKDKLDNYVDGANYLALAADMTELD